ncbi:hypothetical protein PUNSTDRAFT_24760, partial [Punctularia strigosozonata HHB-11173 SS5]|uniref:uncharacterized protein n=1 Tax=Punctularia strigosozonata (strain HHB-11173) TaxID=741275 RepID=UPI000441863E
LSATNLATYHHLQCDLYLHSVYHRAPVSALTANKDGKGHTPAPRPGATSRAHFSRGLKWEHDLLHALDRANQLLTILSVPVPHDGLIATIDCDERDHFYIANASFWPPQRALDALYAQAGISNPVRFGLAKPDLIEVKRAEGVTTWRVIDAKSSASVKTAHHVQIYFYHLCLSHILPGSYVPATTAGVWLPSSPPSASSLVSTPIALLASSLRPFLFSRLPRLLALPAADVSWHLNPLCRTCPYEPAHRTRALTEGAIGAIPNVSVADKGALERLLGAARARDAKLGIGDIEDLHLLFSNPNAVDALERAFPSGVKSAKRILGVPSRTRPHTSPNPSAVLEAALTRTVQVIPRRSFTLPVAEDLALVLSLVLDPATDGVALFSLSLFPSPVVTLPSRLLDQMGKAAQLVPALAATIRATLALGQVVRAQFYVFSSQERTALQRHLIDAALVAGSDKTGDDKGPTDDEDDVRLCIAALCEGASLLATAFQPLILSGALLDFLSRKGTRTKAELRTCLRRMGVTDLARTETVERLRLRVAEEVERLKQLGGRAQPDSDDGAGTAGKEIGQLPLVVVLKREIERLVALPVPGYWDLPECAVALLGSAAAYASDDEIFASYDAGRTVEAEGTLRKRNEGIKRVLDAVRARITKEGRQLLVNEAKPLSAEFMDLCEQPHIRKLFYMQQFEVLAKLSELWRNRVDGCPDAPVLEHISSSSSSAGGTLHTFRLLSGTLDAPGGDKPHAPDQQRSFFDFLLAPDDDSEGSDSDIPPEALFDDLPVMGMVFPLNRWTRPRWDMQPARVRRSLLVADVRDITIDADGMHTRVTLCTWGERAAQPGVGRRYRLSPRLVDFNLTKALSTLLELDMRCAGEGGDDDEGDGVPPFVQLISDPRALALEQAPEGARLGSRFLRREHAIQRTFRERADLGTEEARTLLLKASQRQATRRILSSRLAVVWGPPG